MQDAYPFYYAGKKIVHIEISIKQVLKQGCIYGKSTQC